MKLTKAERWLIGLIFFLFVLFAVSATIILISIQEVLK